MKRYRILTVLLAAVALLALNGCGAVIPPFARISGTVYMDNNGNDIRDAGDTPLPNVEVTFVNAEDILDSNEGAASATTQTDADGNYTFDLTYVDVFPGAYLVFTVPDGLALAEFGVGEDELVNSDVSTSEEHYGKALLEFGEISEAQLRIDALMVEE